MTFFQHFDRLKNLFHKSTQSRFLVLSYKEFLQIIRDPSSILIAFLLPILLLFIFGYGISLDPKHLKIAFIKNQSTELTNEIESHFIHSPYFDVLSAKSIPFIKEKILSGEIKGYIVLEKKFTAHFFNNKLSRVQIVVDGSVPNTASFLQNYASGIFKNWEASYVKRSALFPEKQSRINLEERYWFNAPLNSHYFLVSGSIVIVMSLIGTLLTSLVVAREWEKGTMEYIMSTPTTAFEILGSKVFVYFLLALVSSTLCLICALFIFHIPFRGSIFAFYLLSIAFLMPALGQGLLISSVTKNQFLASQVAILSGFMPSVMLSGFIFEINSMPTWVQWLTYLVPARYLTSCLQTIFMTGDVWPMFLKNSLIMLLIGVFFFLLSTRNTRKRIDL